MAKIVYIGSFYNGSGDIVDEILHGFRQICGKEAVVHYDPGLYLRGGAKAINPVRLEALSPYISRERPEIIVMAAGGLCPASDLREWATANQVAIVSLQLSDPDDFPKRGQPIAGLFDLVATNSLDCLPQYQAVTKAIHLPFGCNDREFDLGTSGSIDHDVCIVGEARPERVRLAQELAGMGVSLNIYGRYWAKWRAPLRMSSLPVPVWKPKYVSGAQKYGTITSSYLYLSFCRTLAGYTNIKVGFYEALSVGAIIAVDADASTLSKELKDIPVEICRFETAQDIVKKLEELKKLCPARLKELRATNRQLFLQNFTWAKRLQTLLDAV